MQQLEHQQQPTLFFGNLPLTVTETKLNGIVKPYQPTSIIIQRDRDTKKPKGFAFVKFRSPQLAIKARRDLNGAMLDQSFITVGVYSKKADPQANLYIGNIPDSMNVQQIDNLLSIYGNILSSKLCYDAQGKFKGYGFVQFANKLESDKTFDDRERLKPLTIEKFVPIFNRVQQGQNRNVYIKGFPLDMTEQELHDKMSYYGQISSYIIQSNGPQDGPKYAYFCYESFESVQAAITDLNGREENGFTWYLAPHEKKHIRKARLIEEYRQRQIDFKERNIFLNKLPSDLTEQQLCQISNCFGNVTSIKMIYLDSISYNEEGEQKQVYKGSGKAFVCYQDAAQAKRAIIGFRRIQIKGVAPYVAKWLPRQELVEKIKQGLARKHFYSTVNNPMRPYLERRTQEPIARPPLQVSNIPRPTVSQQIPKTLIKPAPRPNAQRAQPVLDIPGVEMRQYLMASNEQKLQMLGTAIYNILGKTYPSQINSKLTGMILDVGQAKLEMMLRDQQQLKHCVAQAKTALAEHLNQSGNTDLLKILSQFL